MRKPLFNHFRHLILASKINELKIMFFQSHFLDLLFLICFQFCFKNCRNWDPFKNSVGARMAPKIDQVAPKSWKAIFALGNISWTLFSRSYSINRAVGTSWFLKGHLFDGELLIFCLCLRFVVLCFIQHVYHLFHKTSVNVHPLSPPSFEEIAAHWEQNHVY